MYTVYYYKFPGVYGCCRNVSKRVANNIADARIALGYSVRIVKQEK